jgi:cytochrome P450
MSRHTPTPRAMNIADLDPFCDEFLSDPFPFHEQLREAAPAVWLERYRVWTLARHEHVVAALDDWEMFCSSVGIAMDSLPADTLKCSSGLISR